jgi:hypothetical protein
MKLKLLANGKKFHSLAVPLLGRFHHTFLGNVSIVFQFYCKECPSIYWKHQKKLIFSVV